MRKKETSFGAQTQTDTGDAVAIHSIGLYYGDAMPCLTTADLSVDSDHPGAVGRSGRVCND